MHAGIETAVCLRPFDKLGATARHLAIAFGLIQLDVGLVLYSPEPVERAQKDVWRLTFGAARLRPLGFGVACIALRCMVDSTGLEPATFSMSRKRSNQLS